MGQKQQINSLSKNSLIAAAGDGDIHSNQSLAYNSLIEPRGRWNTRQNLLTWSEDFSNADWVKINATVTSGQSGL